MSGSLQEKLARFDPRLPLERARTIPSFWYFDPEIYAAECRTVFRNAWQMVGRTDQLGEPGAFFTVDLAGDPVVVPRGRGGSVRAFRHFCRHPAARVAGEAAGKGRQLRCRRDSRRLD